MPWSLENTSRSGQTHFGPFCVPPLTRSFPLRVELLAANTNDQGSSFALSVNFAPLRTSIHNLQKASVSLDGHKLKAAEKLEKALKRYEHWREHKKTRGGFFKRVKRRCRKDASAWKASLQRWVKSIFGVRKSALGHNTKQHAGGKDPKLPRPIRDVMKAAQVVLAINAKLSSFERGFISEEGIKEREWYRNLIVAPGKWTGMQTIPLPCCQNRLTYFICLNRIRSHNLPCPQ